MVLLRRKHLLRVSAVLALAAAGVAALLLHDPSDRYVAGERPEGLVDTLARHVPADHPAVRFTDVTREAGLAFTHFPATRTRCLPEDMGSGVALGDVDGDGWTDVFLVNEAGTLDGRAGGWPGSTGWCRLYRNRGDGSFEDITERSGVGLKLLGMAAAFADVDSDGDLDLFVTGYGELWLLQNDGAGVFTDVSEPAGVAGRDGFWTGLAVGDYDNDGQVDLYVCGYVRYREDAAAGGGFASQYGLEIPALTNPSVFEPERNLLFRNRGGGRFEEVAAAAGVTNPGGRSLAAVWCDLSDDGLPDLYVANDVSDNALFLNRGDGTFEDRTHEALVGDYRGAMGLAVGDFDADLDLDLFITHWVAQENALYARIPGGAAASARTVPLYMDVADRHGLGQIALDRVGWATRFFDYDNDGRLDLFVVNGSTIALRDAPEQLTPMRSQLFWNAGPERGFFEVGPVSGEFFRTPAVGRGGATFDYDLDGDEDLLVMCHGAPAVLLRNDGGEEQHSLLLRLRQRTGNRFALGARVRVESDAGESLSVLGTQGSYLSQHAVGELSVGLGTAAVARRVVVTWPDGTSEEAGPLAADELVLWVRGEPPRSEPLPGRMTRARRGPRDVDTQRRFYALTRDAGRARVDGDLPAAMEAYRQALALWPAHEESLYYLGNCLMGTGDEPAALAVLRRMVAYYPNSSRGWMQIGRLHLPGGDPALDDLAAATDAFERSHAINGEESGPVVQLGLVSMLAGDQERAAGHFADAAMLNPRSVEARYFGGRVAFLRGDHGRAARLLQEAHDVVSGRADTNRSASSEGDTRAGGALLAPARAGLLDRWRTLAERPVDPVLEYGEG